MKQKQNNIDQYGRGGDLTPDRARKLIHATFIFDDHPLPYHVSFYNQRKKGKDISPKVLAYNALINRFPDLIDLKPSRVEIYRFEGAQEVTIFDSKK